MTEMPGPSRRSILAGSLFLTFFLVACQETPKQASVADRLNKGLTVRALVSKGPIEDASCVLYNTDAIPVPLTPPTKSNDEGLVNFGYLTNIAVDEVVYVSCSGGSYTDEATGKEGTDAPAALRAGTSIAGSSTIFAVTPATDIAYQLANADNNLADLLEANLRVGKALGLGDDFDPAAIIPTSLVTEKARIDQAGRYGAWLAMLSQLDADNSLADSIDGIINELRICINGDRLAAKCVAHLQNAMNNYVATGATRDNLDSGGASGNAAAILANLDARQDPDAPAIIITDVSPDTFYYEATADAAWRITGTGLDDVTSIRFGALDSSGDCSFELDDRDLLEITGVDCSGLHMPENTTDSSAWITLSNAKGESATFTEFNLSDAPTAQFEWNGWTGFGAGSGDVSIDSGETGFTQTVSFTAESCAGGEISYSLEETSDTLDNGKQFVASVNSTTGAVTFPALTAGTARIKANHRRGHIPGAHGWNRTNQGRQRQGYRFVPAGERRLYPDGASTREKSRLWPVSGNHGKSL